MGGVGRRVLYGLRNTLFTKLQDLPLAFFNENKAGDLISRVNNDTDKLNQFVSQALMQFMGSLFLMTGVAVFVVSLNIRMAIAALLPAIGVFCRHQAYFRMGEAQESQEPAKSGRVEFGNSGKPAQFQGHRGLQPRWITSSESSTSPMMPITAPPSRRALPTTSSCRCTVFRISSRNSWWSPTASS